MIKHISRVFTGVTKQQNSTLRSLLKQYLLAVETNNLWNQRRALLDLFNSTNGLVDKRHKSVPKSSTPESSTPLQASNLVSEWKGLEAFSNDITTEEQLELKINCLNLLLSNYYKYSQIINLDDLQSLYIDFELWKFHNDITKKQFINCLLAAYSNINESNTNDKVKALRFADKVFEDLKTCNQQLLQIVNPEQLPVLKTLCDLLKRNLIIPNHISLDSGAAFKYDTGEVVDLHIEPLKNNGLITLQALADYMSIPYVVKDKPSQQPLYEYYDTLSAPEKQEFMEKYLAFNRIKQINIENNCLNIGIDVNEFELLKTFTNYNKSSPIINWSSFVLDLGNKANNQSRLYNLVLSLIDPNQLANLLLSRSLVYCLKSDSNKPIAGLLQDLIFQFRNLVLKERKFHVSLESDVLINIFGTLLKSFLQHCEIDTEKLNTIIKTSETNDNNKLFTHGIFYKNGKTFGTLRLNPLLKELLYYNLKFLESDGLYLPMIYPPNKWTSPTKGGFLTGLTSVISPKFESHYLPYLQEFTKLGQLNFVYKNLNYMSSVSWCLNSFMVSALKAFSEEFNKIPSSLVENLEIPPNLQDIHKKDYSRLADYQNSRGKRIFLNTLNRVVSGFGDNILYFPHQVDFRGRVYCQVSILGYQLEDIVRGLLQFWESQPLGKNGLTWLKYQLAGLYGMDKLSLADRVKFVDENYHQILESARNPKTESWWTLAENPWQLLSICHELLKISQFEGPVEQYKCRIPIHQDGSCNGLQHYAALGRDYYGGKTVNLISSELKQDVYLEVLKVLISKLNDDNSNHAIIRKLVTRKLVKRPIMTQVYGVTQYGAANQVLDVLKPAYLKNHLNPDELEYYNQNSMTITREIVRVIFDSMSDLFKHTKILQNWLYNNCYRVTSRIDNEDLGYGKEKHIDFLKFNNFKPMMWTSVSGFPVIQFYYKPSRRIIKTPLQTVTIESDLTLGSGLKRDLLKAKRIDLYKQMNAIAPNFIHSLDSVHMLLTCSKCQGEELPFVAVHDSYWTTVNNADRLGQILRAEFASLYSRDLLRYLYEDMNMTMKDSFHLVWFSKTENSKLYDQVNSLRQQYASSNLNQCLNKEIRDSELTSYVNELLKQYQPDLYVKRNNRLYKYEDLKQPDIPFSIKNFTAVIVKASAIKPPPTGDLDIQQVVNSKYFFS